MKRKEAMSELKNDLGVDCISRVEVIDYLCKHCPDDGECFKDCDEIKHLRQMPSVTPQEPRRIHAKWKQLDNEPDTFLATHQYECSNCGKIQLAKSKNIKKFRYCSKCGADMRADRSEEDGNVD